MGGSPASAMPARVSPAHRSCSVRPGPLGPRWRQLAEAAVQEVGGEVDGLVTTVVPDPTAYPVASAKAGTTTSVQATSFST